MSFRPGPQPWRGKRDAMQPQQPGGPALAGRRTDAGTVKLTDRDITGLMLCADHYGSPYDLLLSEAKSPTPDFAFVVCEDIERSARSMYNSLKLERELQDQGIPLFATDEPFNIEGINATTVLVRRVKQGVAEWYRLQLKGKVWDGLKEHSLDGWNLGRPPVGYLGEKHPHPNPIKAAEGRTKTRLIEDPVYGPVISQIYRWRVSNHLGKPTIRARRSNAWGL
jgi:DNA invertase Pin-like site-specific DNA recombinase